jgi:hypothetical protein
MATSLNPLVSNLVMISPMSPLWTPSGLIMMYVLSLGGACISLIINDK